MSAENNFISNVVLDAAMQPELSEREKALRDLFVVEYLHDYDHIAAALRCGFMRSFAQDYAEKFMNEPYVQQKLRMHQQIESGSVQQERSEEVYNKRRVLNSLFREAHYHGVGSSHAARVSALAKLAVIYKMDDEGMGRKSNAKHANRGGVMQVPAIANVDAWEDVAVKQQQKLTEDARDI